jgi:hypothetical protein
MGKNADRLILEWEDQEMDGHKTGDLIVGTHKTGEHKTDDCQRHANTRMRSLFHRVSVSPCHRVSSLSPRHRVSASPCLFLLLLVAAFTASLISCAPTAPTDLSGVVAASVAAAVSATAEQAVVAAAQVTATPVPPTSTATTIPTETLTPTLDWVGTSVAKALYQGTAVKQRNETATQEAQSVAYQLFQTLRKDGSLTMDVGTPFSPDDFSDSMAQNGWYRWWPFDAMDPMADYVILSHIEWQYPEEYKLTMAGSCGFVMRLVDNDRHVIFMINTNNTLWLSQMTVNGYARADIRSPWIQNNHQIRTREKSGSADVAIVAEKERISLYYNGQKDSEWIVARISPGKIGYMIMSDSNTGYGVKCSFSGTQIYPLSEK